MWIIISIRDLWSEKKRKLDSLMKVQNITHKDLGKGETHSWKLQWPAYLDASHWHVQCIFVAHNIHDAELQSQHKILQQHQI